MLQIKLFIIISTQSKVTTPSVGAKPLSKGTFTAVALSLDKEDSFHTPVAKESVLSASIRVGAFDTNAAILHTTSLPDLRSLFSTIPQILSPTAEEEATPDNQGVNEESNEEEEEEGESESEAEEEPASKLKEESGGEESHGEDALREEDDSEEEEWSSSDDEDIHQLVQTLQSYVEESSMFQLDIAAWVIMCTAYCNIM